QLNIPKKILQVPLIKGSVMMIVFLVEFDLVSSLFSLLEYSNLGRWKSKWRRSSIRCEEICGNYTK
ncbi:MAG: hypothetical protein QN651_10930, partial [Nitrososphaeraceae archaeon]|nr:hypothetical protein [Nitrososphaeraceae archaeon]